MTGEEARALWVACQAEDLPERERAFQRLGELLYRLLWQRVKDDPRLQDLAEEAMQESLVIVWQQLAAGRGPDRPESFVSWAAVIALNKLREMIRRLNPSPEIRPAKRIALDRQTSLDAPPAGGGPPLGERLPAESGDAEAALARRERRALAEALATSSRLSSRARFVLLKGFIEDWDDAAIAAGLGTTAANVHVIRCRALARLRADPDLMARVRALED